MRQRLLHFVRGRANVMNRIRNHWRDSNAQSKRDDHCEDCEKSTHDKTGAVAGARSIPLR